MICLLLITFAAIAVIIYIPVGPDPIDRHVPDSLLKGSIQKLDIKFEIHKQGKLLYGEAIVPHDIKRGQIKPTLLKGIKALNKKQSKYRWISFYLYCGGHSNEGGVSPGRAEYKEGITTINYEIPSAKQIEIQKQVIAETPDANPNAVPILLSKESFTKALKIYNLYYKKHNQLSGQYSDLLMKKKISQKQYFKLSDNIIDKSMELVAEETGMTKSEVLKSRENIGYYYGMGWGEETIK